MTPTALTPAAARRRKKTPARPPARASASGQRSKRPAAGAPTAARSKHTAAATAPGHGTTVRRSPVPRAPRRVSGPAPRPRTGTARAPRTTRTRAAAPARQPLGARALGFFRSLPDHALLDRIIRGRAWIPLLGVLLAGIVAMQVEVLKLGAGIGRSIERGTQLQSRNELLRASVATLSDDQRIERLAAAMGMVMPAPDAVNFLSLRPVGYAQRAASSVHQPDSSAFLAALPAVQATPSTTSSATPGVPGGTVDSTPATAAAAGTTAAGTTAAGTTAAGTTAAGTTAAGTTAAGTTAVGTTAAGTTAVGTTAAVPATPSTPSTGGTSTVTGG